MNQYFVGGMALSGASAILYGIIRYIASFDSQVLDTKGPDSKVPDHIDQDGLSDNYKTCDETTLRSRQTTTDEIDSLTEDVNEKCICSVLRKLDKRSKMRELGDEQMLGDSGKLADESGEKLAEESGEKLAEEDWSEFSSTLYAFEGELDLSDVSEIEDPTIMEDGEFACNGRRISWGLGGVWVRFEGFGKGI